MRVIRVTNPFSKDVVINDVKVKSRKTENVGVYTAEKSAVVNSLKKRGYIVTIVEGELKKKATTKAPAKMEGKKPEVTPENKEVKITEQEEPVKSPENSSEKKDSKESNKEDKKEAKPAATPDKPGETAKTEKEYKSSKKA